MSDIIEYILSKFVNPELAYINAIPSKIKQEDNPPKRKYVNAEPVDDSEFLCIQDIMYKLKLCSSIHKYIDPRSALDNSNTAPLTVKIIISVYSIIVNWSAVLFINAAYCFNAVLLVSKLEGSSKGSDRTPDTRLKIDDIFISVYIFLG